MTLGSGERMSIAWYRRVIAQASWTIIDQALLGLSNFASNLVLARWLTPVEYGGYVSASAIFWLLLGAHTGLLSEPMMVFGSGRFRDRHSSSYFAVLAVFHWGISAMVSTALAAADTNRAAIVMTPDRAARARGRRSSIGARACHRSARSRASPVTRPPTSSSSR